MGYKEMLQAEISEAWEKVNDYKKSNMRLFAKEARIHAEGLEHALSIYEKLESLA